VTQSPRKFRVGDLTAVTSTNRIGRGASNLPYVGVVTSVDGGQAVTTVLPSLAARGVFGSTTSHLKVTHPAGPDFDWTDVTRPARDSEAPVVKDMWRTSDAQLRLETGAIIASLGFQYLAGKDGAVVVAGKDGTIVVDDPHKGAATVASLRPLDRIRGPLEDRSVTPPTVLLAADGEATVVAIDMAPGDGQSLVLRIRRDSDNRFFRLAILRSAFVRLAA
jgi:hypothetical protein